MASRYACPPVMTLVKPTKYEEGPWGDQRPRICLLKTPGAPEAPITDAFVKLGEKCGIFLTPWERWLLGQALRRNPDGTWENPELWVLVCRRNGKNVVLKVLEIGLILLMPEVTRINHSAHELRGAKDHLGELHRHLAHLGQAFFTKNKIYLKTGNEDPSLTFEVDGIPKRIRAIARTNDGGRGQECDVLVLDEALKLTNPQMAAITPLTMAVWNPLKIYTSSHAYEEGDVLNTQRSLVLAGEAKAGDVGWVEWSAEPGALSDDVAAICAANPSLGYVFGLDRIESQRRVLRADPKKFRVEHLGLLDEAEKKPPKIDPSVWARLKIAPGEIFPDGPVSIGIDRSPRGTETTLVVAGHRADSRVQVEKIRQEEGDPGWVVEQVHRIGESLYIKAVVIDGKSAAAVLADPLKAAGFEVTLTNLPDVNVACQTVMDLIEADQLRHPGDVGLTAAVEGSVERVTNAETGAWAWGREDSQVTITPTIAMTLAVWGLTAHKAKKATRTRAPRPETSGPVVDAPRRALTGAVLAW